MADFDELCESVFSQRPFILVSNRGPVEHQMTPQGRPEPRRGGGSVVTAFNSLAQQYEFTWVSSAMGEGDRAVSGNPPGQRIKSPLPGHRINLRYVVTPRRTYHKYYNVLCNPLLWFLQHYMWNPPYNPTIDAAVYDAWETGYVPVNRSFARAVVDEAQGQAAAPVVVGHDYHLYLLPEFVRQELPAAVIQHYIHIPWPAPLYWQLIPRHITERICAALCSADLLGFQTDLDRRSFLDTVEEFVPQARIDRPGNAVELEGGRCAVRVYPSAINVDEVQRIAQSPRALEFQERLAAEAGEITIMRIDRAEPTKNIIRGLRAYELLLTRYPELQGRVKFLAFLVPSRTHIRQYQRYMDEINQAIQEINGRYGVNGWTPVTAFIENNYVQAIAGMKLYDVLLVNTIVEGTNLVAMEGPVVNERNGALVLSQSSGVYRQLAEGALPVAAADIEGTMETLHRAVTMPAADRRARAERLVQAICRNDLDHWLRRQLEDIASLLPPRLA